MVKNNILLVSDEEDYILYVKKQISLLRESDEIVSCSSSADIKKIIQKSGFNVILLKELNSTQSNIRTIQSIKDVNPISKIILITDNSDPNFIFEMFDAGISEYITTDFTPQDILIKIINCYKMAQLETKAQRNEKLLKDTGIINLKTEMYETKYLPEIYSDICDQPSIINGVLIVLTIDPKIKTKISTNRLCGIIRNNTRSNDILASSRSGKFYIILSNIEIEDAKNFIEKIQNNIGDEIPIRAGFSKIGIQSYETLEKNTKDSLKSAIQNDELYASLTDNNPNGDIWLDSGNKNNKQYKLFAKIYKQKIDEVISIVFFRTQKDYEIKLADTDVSQYSNNIESVFSLKNEKTHSELIIRPYGLAKFSIEIHHKGLNSAENSKLEIPLNKLDEKELNKLLNKLKKEYCQTAYSE